MAIITNKHAGLITHTILLHYGGSQYSHSYNYLFVEDVESVRNIEITEDNRHLVITINLEYDDKL